MKQDWLTITTLPKLEHSLYEALQFQIEPAQYQEMLMLPEERFRECIQSITPSEGQPVSSDLLHEIYVLRTSDYYSYSLLSYKKPVTEDIRSKLYRMQASAAVVDLALDGTLSRWYFSRDRKDALKISGRAIDTISIVSTLFPYEIFIIPQFIPTIYSSTYTGMRTKKYNTIELNSHGGYHTLIITSADSAASPLAEQTFQLRNQIISLYDLILLMLEKYVAIQNEASVGTSPLSVSKGTNINSLENRFARMNIPNTGVHGEKISPKEHIRTEHLRHYKNGNVVRIGATIVNKGHTKTTYFS